MVVWKQNQEGQAGLQRMVWSAEYTICSEIPDLQSFYSKQYWIKIANDLSHLNNGLCFLLYSVRRFCFLKANTEEMWRRIFPQVMCTLNLNTPRTGLGLGNMSSQPVWHLAGEGTVQPLKKLIMIRTFAWFSNTHLHIILRISLHCVGQLTMTEQASWF